MWGYHLTVDCAGCNDNIKNEALLPYLDHRISDGEALEVTVGHMRNFMLAQVDPGDLELMLTISDPDKMLAPQEADVRLADIPTTTLVPAFLLSELKRAFEMGFMIYLPFVVIDLVVASTLISMGMLVLPPVLISLPFKVLIFVLVDGWGQRGASALLRARPRGSGRGDLPRAEVANGLPRVDHGADARRRRDTDQDRRPGRRSQSLLCGDRCRLRRDARGQGAAAGRGQYLGPKQ